MVNLIRHFIKKLFTWKIRMFDCLSEVEIQELTDGELGSNVSRFMEIVDTMKNDNYFIDLGVETGKSSKIMTQ